MIRFKKALLLVTFLLLLVVGICLPTFLYAQEPGCDPLCNCRADGSICPYDNNLYILLAIGALYGVKKVRNTRKKQRVESLEV